MTEQAAKDWARGDAYGLPIPSGATQLLEGGADWLTQAFRAIGSLDEDERVRAITRCDGFTGGGSGTKALLSLEYDSQRMDLPKDLFVKFSRNFDDVAMDNARFHMGPEARFAALSRAPDFPIAVPECFFADFEAESGTGLLITSCIPFGQDGIEPQILKCMDHLLDDPLTHYRALIRTIARLAGSFKAGRLPDSVAKAFPFDREAAMQADRLPPDFAKLRNRIDRYAAFARECPRLLPAEIRSEGFLEALLRDAQLFHASQDAIRQFLHSSDDYVALSHWNANIDNAWFWCDADGALQCGLLDWGSVGQIHVGMTLWGCLSGADRRVWDGHLAELLELFASEYADAGGPVLDREELRVRFLLYMAMMGLRWLMDAPARIAREVEDLPSCNGPVDARILASETARVQLQMMTNFLSQWQAEDIGAILRERIGIAAPAL